MKETPGSSETSVLTRATQPNNPEDTILHSHRRENLKSYNCPNGYQTIYSYPVELNAARMKTRAGRWDEQNSYSRGRDLITFLKGCIT
jgi:hypothetical protein